MGAYKEIYLADANELMRLVFEETAKNKTLDFEHFVEGFMKSKYRILMDNGSTRVINMTYDELIAYLHRDCKNIYRKGKFTIDYLQAGWMGVIYNTLQFKLKVSSQEIYDKLPLRRMMKYFEPLHTVSEEVAIEKLLSVI